MIIYGIKDRVSEGCFGNPFPCTKKYLVNGRLSVHFGSDFGAVKKKQSGCMCKSGFKWIQTVNLEGNT